MLERAKEKYTSIKPFIVHNMWAGMTTSLKAVSQLAILKMTTVFLGASALGVLGQAMSCVVIFQSLSNGGVVNHLITSLAKCKNDEVAKRAILGSVGLWAVVSQIILFVPCVFFSGALAELIFSEREYGWFFKTMGFVIFVFSLGAFSQGSLSAFKRIKFVFLSGLISFFFGTVGFYFILTEVGVHGAVLGALLVFLVQGLSMFLFVVRLKDVKIRYLFPKYTPTVMRSLINFSIVMFVTGVLGSLYQVVMRSYLTASLGLSWSDVGNWQAIIKISEITMSFMGVSIATSYLPRVSESASVAEVIVVVNSYGRKFAILVVASCAFIAILAPVVLQLVYSREFVGLASLLRLQLFGDVFRLCAWIFTYLFLSRLSLWIFLAFEVSSVVVLLVSGIVLSRYFGISGLVYAQCATSFTGLVAASLIYKFIFKSGHRWVR